MDGREHLAWCVERAMEYANRGEMVQAWASFGSDCMNHPVTAYIPGHLLYGMEMLRQVHADAGVRDFHDFISGWAVREPTPAD
jgi:hypothetical protein